MIEPTGLRVDGQVDPNGIVAGPSFSWRLAGGHRGARQVAYRLRVVAHHATGDVETWDSGEVATATTRGVAYAGEGLRSSTGHTWTVEVVDETGDRSSASAAFGTGILDVAEWEAAWIGRNPDYKQTAAPPQDTDITYTVNKLQPVRRFIHHVDLDAVPARARVHASAQGAYRLYVNGIRVGDDELAPGWTEYRDRITYQSWDIAGLLRPGRNSIAALLGDGWYVGFIGTDRRHQAQHYGTTPALLAQVVLDDTDGSRRVIATGASGWKESPSDIIYADMLMGQYEDSRRAEPGWHLPDHDTGGWLDAVVVSTDHSKLVPESDPAVRATDRLSAVSVTPRSDGVHIVDFGQNLVGRVRLTLRGQAEGTRVQLNHAEVLDEGELYTANLRTAEPVDVFWTDGSPEQVFEPRFTLHGFRFAEIRGVVGTVDPADVEAVVLHSGFARTGEFATSSADIDQLSSNIWWGLRGNLVSIPTDCPQRDERLGWLADAQVITPTALAYADVAPMLRRWLHDVRSAQNERGAFPDIAPHLIHLRDGAPAWGDGGVTIPWNLYRATGDTDILAEAADSMVAWVRHLERANPDLLWRERVGNNYGDWLQIGEETAKDVLSTAYFAHSTRLTARAFAVLGRAAEAADLDALADRIGAAFRAEFVAADGTVTGDTQGGYLLALAFRLVEGDLRAAVAERLVNAVERRDRSLTTGFVTVGLLCPVLVEIGRPDLASALLHNDRYPSWLFSVRNGATTIWERWDGWTPENGFQSPRMNSFNHFSLGAVGAWFYSGILGIDQAETSAGFDEPVLAPVLDPRLDWAGGSLDTPRGRIASRWERSGDEVVWDVTIPPGPAAVAVLPGAPADITEGGETALGSEGVSLLTETRGHTRLRVESGSYRFRFPSG